MKTTTNYQIGKQDRSALFVTTFMEIFIAARHFTQVHRLPQLYVQLRTTLRGWLVTRNMYNEKPSPPSRQRRFQVKNNCLNQTNRTKKLVYGFLGSALLDITNKTDRILSLQMACLSANPNSNHLYRFTLDPIPMTQRNCQIKMWTQWEYYNDLGDGSKTWLTRNYFSHGTTQLQSLRKHRII